MKLNDQDPPEAAQQATHSPMELPATDHAWPTVLPACNGPKSRGRSFNDILKRPAEIRHALALREAGTPSKAFFHSRTFSPQHPRLQQSQTRYSCLEPHAHADRLGPLPEEALCPAGQRLHAIVQCVKGLRHGMLVKPHGRRHGPQFSRWLTAPGPAGRGDVLAQSAPYRPRAHLPPRHEDAIAQQIATPRPGWTLLWPT